MYVCVLVGKLGHGWPQLGLLVRALMGTLYYIWVVVSCTSI
jgi:hypothetical protein